jgi:hypothetical protein
VKSTVTLYVRDSDPVVAALILRERALLRHEGKVYVKPYVRRWPGGILAARRAERKAARRKSYPPVYKTRYVYEHAR